MPYIRIHLDDLEELLKQARASADESADLLVEVHDVSELAAELADVDAATVARSIIDQIGIEREILEDLRQEALEVQLDAAPVSETRRIAMEILREQGGLADLAAELLREAFPAGGWGDWRLRAWAEDHQILPRLQEA